MTRIHCSHSSLLERRSPRKDEQCFNFEVLSLIDTGLWALWERVIESENVQGTCALKEVECREVSPPGVTIESERSEQGRKMSERLCRRLYAHGWCAGVRASCARSRLDPLTPRMALRCGISAWGCMCLGW